MTATRIGQDPMRGRRLTSSIWKMLVRFAIWLIAPAWDKEHNWQ